MKLFIDPMPTLKQERKDRVNTAFNSSVNTFLIQVYLRKRIMAENKDSALQAEADLRGISLDELCELILSKPEPIMVHEDRRQKIMAKIDEAKTPQELDELSW